MQPIDILKELLKREEKSLAKHTLEYTREKIRFEKLIEGADKRIKNLKKAINKLKEN